MNDSRLQQAEAALDDARTLLADILEELPDNDRDANDIRLTRLAINTAIGNIHTLKTR